MTDEQLMLAYAQGDKQAFDEIYRRHKAKVLGYLVQRIHHKSEAEEVFQEVFIKLHLNKSKYSVEYPFLSWLFTLTKNAMIDHIRKQDTLGKFVALNNELVENAAEDHVSEKNFTQSIEKMNSLTDHQKAILQLRLEEGFTFAEIAEKLDISGSNARKLMSRAVVKIRQWFAREA